MDWTFPLLGFVIGVMVGLSGIGGGLLMTPLLMLVGGVRTNEAREDQGVEPE
jgi:uncharacterized membrane protein YfcA